MSGRREFTQAQQRLAALMNTNPAEAVSEAKALPDHDANWRLLRATILCDAGVAAADAAAVDEAIAIFSSIHDALPRDGVTTYNLANAVAARAQLDEPHDPDWSLRTAQARRRARALYGDAARLLRESDPRLASQALTNLGNSLDAAARWIEAFECYQQAREIFPQNGVASGCAARVLYRVASIGLLGHEPHLVDIAARLGHHAKGHAKVVAELAGPKAVAAFKKLRSRAGPQASASLRSGTGAFERFVAEHRLLLSPVLEGLGHDPKRWDDAHIAGLTESASTGATVPPLFAMFNVMKGDYLVARELLFNGLRDIEVSTSRDTGLYMDTLDYAIYGAAPSRLVLAQRAALDVLDKIAAALNEHLSVGVKLKDCHFHTFWRDKPNQPAWRPVLADAIRVGNPALVALSEIATDLTEGAEDGSAPGLLAPEKRARHAGTHRFVVLHDLKIGDSRPSDAIEHRDVEAFTEMAIRTMRLVRAALLHFLEAVGYVEHARPRDGKIIGEMLVHAHHYIRGDD